MDGAGGADTLLGGLGADTLIGGLGGDVLDGGLDADIIVIGSAFGFGSDTVNGFRTTAVDAASGRDEGEAPPDRPARTAWLPAAA